MATEKATATAAPSDNVSARELAQELAGAISGMQPKQKVSFAALKTDTPFNKSGKRSRKCARPTFINGLLADNMATTLFDEEIALLNKIKPGRYINGLVTVTERDLGPDGFAIYLWYPNRTMTQRMTMKGEAKDFRTLLRRCLDEAK